MLRWLQGTESRAVLEAILPGVDHAGEVAAALASTAGIDGCAAHTSAEQIPDMLPDRVEEQVATLLQSCGLQTGNSSSIAFKVRAAHYTAVPMLQSFPCCRHGDANAWQQCGNKVQSAQLQAVPAHA